MYRFPRRHQTTVVHGRPQRHRAHCFVLIFVYFRHVLQRLASSLQNGIVLDKYVDLKTTVDESFTVC